MDYQHLTTFERGRIEALHNLGYTVREIGRQMNRHHSTIARELSRNNNINYCCETVQEAYFYRRKASKPKGKCSPKLVMAIEHALDATWSPEQISNTITKGKIRGDLDAYPPFLWK
jgi:IS30 family transposase